VKVFSSNVLRVLRNRGGEATEACQEKMKAYTERTEALMNSCQEPGTTSLEEVKATDFEINTEEI
jgi:hypothetical protein